MATKQKHDKLYVFNEMPVGKAVSYLVIPTILTQIISILYNLADTFFIGKMNDSALVAAVGVCLPPMMLMTAIANLFGVGASSAISRALGAGDERRARLCSSFSFWCGLVVAAIYVVLTVAFRDGFISIIGGTAEVAPYVQEYLLWTMTLGGLVFFMAGLLTHFVKTLGKAGPASIAVAAGAVLNIALDPLFLFVLDMGIAGVAIASLIGQALTVAMLVAVLVRCKGEGIIVPAPSVAAFGEGIPSEVVQIGLISFLQTCLAQVSNVAINILVSPYGASYLAASSVAIKLNIANFSLAQGLSVGVLPLLGFNYAKGNAARVKAALKIQVGFILGVTVCTTALCFAFPAQIIAFFVNDPTTIDCGQIYIRAVALCMIPSTLVFAANSYMQSTGDKRRPLITTFTRMGTVDVLFMVILAYTAGAPYILFGKPIADWICVCTAVLVLRNLSKHRDPFDGTVQK